MGIALIVCIFAIYYQREEIATYKDNDLKYRYVKMQGTTTPENIANLENIFENRRDSVIIVRKQVEQCEKTVIEEAKRLEQARLKEQEAEQLKREAESLKQSK
jgi:phosphoenolpyruvate synthase/pyruvate phosphate dikinase